MNLKTKKIEEDNIKFIYIYKMKKKGKKKEKKKIFKFFLKK